MLYPFYKHNAARKYKKLIARIEFYSIPEPMSGCTLWCGAVSGDRYPRLSVGVGNWRVSRLVWTMKHGPIPNGMHVLHRCDMPLCVDVDHLFLGTAIENMADKVRKNRHAKGEKCRSMRLTAANVLLIREDDRSCGEIAESYGVKKAAIWKIKARKTWKNLS